MGAKVNGYQPTDVQEVGPSDMPVDCRENIPIATYQKCSPDLLRRGRLLAVAVLRVPRGELRRHLHGVRPGAGSGGDSAIGAVSAAIAAKGSTLADVFNAWSTVQMTGYGIAQLDTVKPDAVRVGARPDDDDSRTSRR